MTVFRSARRPRMIPLAAPLIGILLSKALTEAYQLSPTRRQSRDTVRPSRLALSSTSETTAGEATLRTLSFAQVPKDQNPDLLCDFLLELGACSTAITDADAGTAAEVPLVAEPSDDYNPWRYDSQELGDKWTPVPLWNRCTVSAHFPDGVDMGRVLEQVRATALFDGGDDAETPGGTSHWLANPHVEVLPNQDWLVTVQQGWKPILVADRVLLRFPWHTEADVDAVLRAATSDGNPRGSAHDGVVQLELQGGIAFGTGEHPTTQLCLEWLERTVRRELTTARTGPPAPLTVLDYGAGSGVLGMAACAMARDGVAAIGIEIDYDSCRIANANARRNRVDMRTYLPPLAATTDGESQSLLLKAHAHARRRLEQDAQREGTGETPEDDVFLPDRLRERQYDITVANILAGPLVTLAPTLAAMTKPGGRIGLSGIIPRQGEQVAEAYRRAGFADVQVERELNRWVLVTGVRAME